MRVKVKCQPMSLKQCGNPSKVQKGNLCINTVFSLVVSFQSSMKRLLSVNWVNECSARPKPELQTCLPFKRLLDCIVSLLMDHHPSDCSDFCTLPQTLEWLLSGV